MKMRQSKKRIDLEIERGRHGPSLLSINDIPFESYSSLSSSATLSTYSGIFCINFPKCSSSSIVDNFSICIIGQNLLIPVAIFIALKATRVLDDRRIPIPSIENPVNRRIWASKVPTFFFKSSSPCMVI